VLSDTPKENDHEHNSDNDQQVKKQNQMGHYYGFKQILTLIFTFVGHGLACIRNCKSALINPMSNSH
jgi:hypothetical protein